MPKFKVPEVAIQRLSFYLRALKKFTDEGILSSQGLAKLVGTTATQVRKDLAYFGEFGMPGQGYDIGKLKQEIMHVLAIDRKWKLALAGVGKLGAALLAYPGFKREEFEIAVLFDNDPEKVGKKVEGVVIQPVDNMVDIVRARGINIGIITTPAEAAQSVVDKMVEGGIEGILNFAPIRLKVFEKIKLKNVDLSLELESLSYFLSSKANERKRMKHATTKSRQ